MLVLNNYLKLAVMAAATPVTACAPALTYLGSPPRLKPGRETWGYTDKKSLFSYVPTILLQMAFWEKNKDHYLEKMISPTNRAICRTPIDALMPYLPKTSLELIEQMGGDQQTHFAMRIQIVVQQFLFCYATGMSFTTSKLAPRAEAVVGVGSKEKECDAAHSSTLPRLIYEMGGKEHVLAGQTFFYHTWNTTVLLYAANDVDSSLDMHHHKLGQTQALRSYTQFLLDRVADPKGLVTPFVALTHFLGHAEILLNAFEAKGKPTPSESVVIKNYLTVVHDYQKGMKQDAAFFNKLCSYKGTLNKEFYTLIRDGMHGIVSIEGSLIVPPPQTGSELEIAGHTITLELTKKIKEHASTCSLDATIMALAALYLKTQHIVQDHEALKSISGLQKIATSKKLSAEMKALIKACHAHLKATNKKNPKNMPTIVQYLLSNKKA